MIDQVNDTCLQELVRINKEIETVRHLVEQEQRQLSNYQTVQAEKGNLASVSPLSWSKTSKSIDTGVYEPSPCSHLQDRKYVVDSSKPRTDLEYDPLSNFSSDLSSYSSSRRGQKLKNGQTLKKARIVGPCNQKRPSQTQLSRLPSPEPEWMDDDILIIDIPPSPQQKGEQGHKHSHSVTDKSPQAHEINKDEGPTILLDSPPQYSKPEVLDIDEISDDNSAETKNLANVNESGPSDDKASGTDLKKSLEQSRTRVEQAQTMSYVQNRFGNQTSSVNTLSVLPHGQKSSTRIAAPIQGKPENCAEEQISSGQMQSDESSASNQLLEKNDERVIVIDSSSDDERNSLEMELSDSDPMEECYRIFMEENEENPAEELADETVS